MGKLSFFKRWGKTGEGASKFAHFTSKFKRLKNFNFIEKLKKFKKFTKEFKFLEKLPSLNKLTTLAVFLSIFGITYEANKGIKNIKDAFTDPVFIGTFLTSICLSVFIIYMVTRDKTSPKQEGGGKLQPQEIICIFIGIIFLYLLLDFLYELFIEFEKFCELEEQKEKLYQYDQITQNY